MELNSYRHSQIIGKFLISKGILVASDISSLQDKSLDEYSDDQIDQLGMEELLELEESSGGSNIFKGKVVTGTVVQVDQEYIYLDYGQKSEGRVPRSEVEGEVQVNEQYNAVVVRSQSATEQPLLSIREANRKIAWDRLTTEEDISSMVVIGTIKRIVNGGYIVDVSGLNFFLPGSQLGDIKVKDSSDILDKSFEFKVLRLDERRKSGVLSHRQLLDDRKHERWNQFLGNYTEGDITEGEVKGLTDYGAFIEVDGVKGLMHISDMSWKRSVRPKDLLKKDDTVRLKILSIDQENQKVSFGMKQLTEDPWNVFVRSHEEGAQLKGLVTQLMNYGAFVEVSDGVEGLIHISELSWSRRVNHPKQVVQKGDEVEVVILKIDADEKRLSLSLKDVYDNPWQKISEQYKVGDVASGKITKLTKFGAFVALDEEVEGLIHVNDMSWESVTNPSDVVQEGQEVQCKIMELVPEERKITCSIKHMSRSPWEVLRDKYPSNTIVEGEVSGVTPFGVFLEIEPKVEGLIHVSQLPKADAEDLTEKYKKGDKLKAVVLNVDTKKKRISLSIKDYEKAKEKETIKQYMHESDQPKVTLGDLVNIDLPDEEK